MRKSAVVVTLFGLTVVLSGSGQVEAEKPARFTLVYNVNNSGYIDVCGCKHKQVRQGSLTRRSSFLKQLHATGRNLLLLDGGSSLFKVGELIKKEQRDEAIRKAQLIVEAYNRMGYHAMAVGPADLYAGLDETLALRKKAKFKFLSANAYDKNTGKLLFEPHAVFEVGGARVGVIGLTLQTISKPFLRRIGSRFEVRDAETALRESIEALKPKTDSLIVLCHEREEVSKKFAAAFPEIHMLVDPYIQYGNHHTWIKKHEWLDRVEETVFLRSDGQGARLGVVDVELKHGSRPLVSRIDLEDLAAAVAAADANVTDADKEKLISWRAFNPFDFQRVSLEPHHLSDPDIDRLVDEWKKNVDPSKVARLEAELPRRAEYATADKCKGCHETQYDWWKKTRHATAFATLQRTGDHQRFDCIGCHTLGYGEAFLNTTAVGEFADVQCESCHGTNPKHLESPATHSYRKITKHDCLVCHNKEQTLKDFAFAAARRRIACPSSKKS